MSPADHKRPTGSGHAEGQVDIHLEPAGRTVTVPAGTLLGDAISQAGIRLGLPCGGQGRCGRCVVQVKQGSVRRRSTIRLDDRQIEEGYALACQTVVGSDAVVWVPPEQERLERVAGGDLAEKAAMEVAPCEHHAAPLVSRRRVTVERPSMEDNVPDLERLQRELTRRHGIRGVFPTLTALTRLPEALRSGEWTVTAELEQRDLQGRPPLPAADATSAADYRLLDVFPGSAPVRSFGAAIDVGTTTVVAYLTDLGAAKVMDGVSGYNEQIARGEDVVSRIIYARQPQRRRELQERVVGTINELLDEMMTRQHLRSDDLTTLVVAGNTTMIHLLLGLEPAYIRLEPYVGAAGRFPLLSAARIGLHVHPEALVDCLPAVGAYVGGDITAGVLRSGMHEDDAVTLFLDIGTNGEMVLGNSEWLIGCACSAGPAFEGAGAVSGMRAVRGAIEEVWIEPHTLEPTVTTVGGDVPRGICGSGMISLLGELFLTRIIDKRGRIAAGAPTRRVRERHNGLEYVVVWAADTVTGERDIVIAETDIINILRAKGAIYAGATVLCESVGLSMGDVDRVLIGGSFGRHIDVEKAIQIGLLPDMPWDRFSYLGNTSLQGAYLGLTCRECRAEIDRIASKMTYLELSADNRFMDAFTSAVFLPHTDESLFPSVQRSLAGVYPEGAHT
jgi:uncharacterized 2Fe-2S/4Fe-4S cluster protein (DUF4445 family)